MHPVSDLWEGRLLQLAGAGSAECMAHLPAAHYSPSHLERAFRRCEQITARHSKSFYMASALLPRHKRLAARALYAFCRTTDDLVDETANPSAAHEALLRWRKTALSDHPPQDLEVAVAWAAARRHYAIPARYAEQLIEGVGRDLIQTRYTSFHDLTLYCYQVASTVGLMSMHIIGYSSDDAVRYAIRLGMALQLTNILRDVGEDWAGGRLYLPQDELEAFDLSEDDIARGVVDERWRRFMDFQITRARRLYAEAMPGIELLHPDGRLAIGAAATFYAAILDTIERSDYDVFHRRASVSDAQKLRLLPRLWWQYRRKSAPAYH